VKIIFLLIAFLFCSYYCLAQFNKGTLFVSGNAAYSYKKNNELSGSSSTTIKNLSITPSIGFIPVKGLVVGGELSWRSEKDEVKNTSSYIYYKSVSRSYSIGPFVRYYPYAGLFIHGSYFWGSAKIELSMITLGPGSGIDEYGGTTTQKLNGFTIGPGYTFLLGSHKQVGVDIFVGYNRYDMASVPYSGVVVGIGISGFLHKDQQ
jgi:hypothetical protein